MVPCPGVYRFLFAELFSWMYIFCLPSPEAFSWSLLLLAFILKPMKFFLAAVAFMAAFVLNGNLLEWEVKGLYRLFMKNINIWGCFFFLHFASFVVMAWFFFLGNSHSLLFLYSVWNHFHKFSKIERDAMMDGSNSDQQLSIDCR
ncbi:hypothetical protein [Bacillus smithii]|uniref:hypothetical protein n=1 Tax=Bacillus smithii TaxID=1479 RepID=UPI0022E64CAA|nr:hypothetical protein [Bacillus smithii]